MAVNFMNRTRKTVTSYAMFICKCICNKKQRYTFFIFHPLRGCIKCDTERIFMRVNVQHRHEASRVPSEDLSSLYPKHFKEGSFQFSLNVLENVRDN